MKPKWKFVVEDIGFKTIVTILLLGAAVGLSVIWVFIKLYNPIELSSYGDIGWQLLKEDFPYLWLVGAMVLGVAGWFLEQKIGNNYKKTWMFWAGVTIVAIMVVGMIIAGLNLIDLR